MIDSSIGELFDAINNSQEYKEYMEISSIISSDTEVVNLIEEIKELQKKATKLEYDNDDKYMEIDREIEDKINLLNSNESYKEYLAKLKVFNNMLSKSSSMIEGYVEEKVSI